MSSSIKSPVVPDAAGQAEKQAGGKQMVLQTPRFKKLLQNHLNAIATNDIKQCERRAFRLLGATFQLRDIAHGEIKIPGKCSLAQVRLFSQRANFLAADRLGSTECLRTR
jgi:hypothetical protein